MPNLTYNICTETGLHQFVVEASTAGFPVGKWPERVKTDMGNKLPFLRGRPCYHVNDEGDRELLYWNYAQTNGCLTVKVFND